MYTFHSQSNIITEPLNYALMIFLCIRFNNNIIITINVVVIEI